MRCEDLLLWPVDCIHSEMAMIPKDGGGTRLVALIHTLIRVWARVRRPLSRQWLQQFPSEMVWGNRKGYSSSGSAFMHNAMAE
eukprot:4287800-Pyramimonas_sp.AAC.1